jgi:hypothetical protein
MKKFIVIDNSVNDGVYIYYNIKTKNQLIKAIINKLLTEENLDDRFEEFLNDIEINIYEVNKEIILEDE